MEASVTRTMLEEGSVALMELEDLVLILEVLTSKTAGVVGVTRTTSDEGLDLESKKLGSLLSTVFSVPRVPP